VPVRLHRGGRFRTWLGQRLGGDYALGDRAWRRILHLLGLLALLYYVVPPDFFVVVSTQEVLILILAAALIAEAGRHLFRVEIPLIRPVEEDRIASFVYFAVALVAAVLIFPMPVATVVVIGTSVFDPFVGELRGSARFGRYYPSAPVALYAVMAAGVLFALTTWSPVEVILLAIAGAVVAIASEAPKTKWIDDDLAMTLLPGLLLWGLTLIWP
jgi:hypothetical protein